MKKIILFYIFFVFCFAQFGIAQTNQTTLKTFNIHKNSRTFVKKPNRKYLKNKATQNLNPGNPIRKK